MFPFPDQNPQCQASWSGAGGGGWDWQRGWESEQPAALQGGSDQGVNAVWLGPHTIRDEVRVWRGVWIVNQTLVGILGCK